MNSGIRSMGDTIQATSPTTTSAHVERSAAIDDEGPQQPQDVRDEPDQLTDADALRSQRPEDHQERGPHEDHRNEDRDDRRWLHAATVSHSGECDRG